MRRLVLIVLCTLAVAAPAAAEKNPQPKTFTAVGTLVARTATSVTVQSGTATVACSFSKSSPRVADVSVGNRVKIACSKGVVVAIGKVSDTPKTAAPKADPPKPPVTTRAARGTLSALSAASVTVTTDGGDVTCSVGDSSPKLGDFHVGDKVKLYCVNDLVYALVKTDTTTAPPTPPPPPLPTTPKYTGALGTISSLSVDRITLSTDGGSVSCYVASSSPSTAEFHVGDRAKMYCADGVLTTLARA
ncbi:MAG: hypothetical protein ACYDA3_09290 [Gaiellaceae bacterium]